ncbi:thioesterase family protein [Fulvimarina sp. MAC3]|uniref:acyl-CoA thioesterase n=1 Tax=Fulvimarina sp. MAC3 TaxID=3148887 RepID=UPI0031FBCC51
MADHSENGIDLGGFVVHPWHLDQFGHMNVRWYAPVFDDASFLFWEKAGLSMRAMTEIHGVHTVTLKAETEFKRELLAGDCTFIGGRVTRVGGKSVTLEMTLHTYRTGEVHAIYRTVEVFVEAGSHASCAIPDAVRETLEGYLPDEG